MTMTLEELRESLDVGCLPNTDRSRWFAAIDAAIRERDELRESLKSRAAHITVPTETMQQECVAYARPFKDRAEKAEAALAALKAASETHEHDTGYGTTPGMWGLLSEELDGVKLPESLNTAIYALRDDRAAVVSK